MTKQRVFTDIMSIYHPYDNVCDEKREKNKRVNEKTFN